MTLKEFLQEQAGQLRPQEAARREHRKEWIAAVERLLAQMTDWLMDSDQEKILNLERRLVERNEEGIWMYRIPALSIQLGSRTVNVEPVAWSVLGPAVIRPQEGQFRGRVDILGNSYGYTLYRLVDPSGVERWLMIDNRDFKSQTFSREPFEAALVDLLG
jgi:hypothetical protein